MNILEQWLYLGALIALVIAVAILTKRVLASHTCFELQNDMNRILIEINLDRENQIAKLESRIRDLERWRKNT